MDGGLRDPGVPQGCAVGPGFLASVSVSHWAPRCLCEKCRSLASFPRDSDFVGLIGAGPANLFILYVHPGCLLSSGKFEKHSSIESLEEIKKI